VGHDLQVSGGGQAGSHSRTVLVLLAAGVVAAVGVALLVAGLLAFGAASDTRDRADALQRDRADIVERTRVAERGADEPIGRTEKVTTSVSDTLEAGDTVVEKSAAASAVLQRAVALANDGDLGAARGLYSGEAAVSVRELNEQLAKARAALATAQQAVADLTAPTP
jgi:hypothetical protein